MVHGNYGEFMVLVDDETVIDGGALAVLGVLPSGRKIVEAVRTRLSAGQSAASAHSSSSTMDGGMKG